VGGVPSSHSGSQDTLAVPSLSGGAVAEAWVGGVPSSHSGSQDTLAVPLLSGGAVAEAWVGWVGRVTYRRGQDGCGFRICWVGADEEVAVLGEEADVVRSAL
jgi:hypothetical protein